MASRIINVATATRSGTLTLPANGLGFSIPAQFDHVEAHATMPQATLDDPATHLTYTVQFRRAATDPWTDFLGGPDGVFNGGPNQGKNGGATINPGFVFDVPVARTGLVFQVVTDIPSPIPVGATVDLS